MRDDTPPVGFVDQKPDEALYAAPTECPFCASRKVDSYETYTAASGGGGHKWHGCRCKGCGKKFVREDAHEQTWYTWDRRVLKGYPNCYEGYVYTHKDCGGDVTRRLTALNGVEEVHSLHTKIVDGKWIKQYRAFYDCAKCLATAECTRKEGKDDPDYPPGDSEAVRTTDENSHVITGGGVWWQRINWNIWRPLIIVVVMFTLGFMFRRWFL